MRESSIIGDSVAGSSAIDGDLDFPEDEDEDSAEFFVLWFAS